MPAPLAYRLKVSASVQSDLYQHLPYYNALTGDKTTNRQYEESIVQQMLQQLKDRQHRKNK